MLRDGQDVVVSGLRLADARGEDPRLASYHTQPDDLGRVAAGARAKKLAVTHLMPGSEPHELEAAARKHFAGPLVVGTDLLEV